MGIISNIGKRTKSFNTLANGVGNATNILDNYETSKDADWLIFAAWVCKVGVIDVIESGQLNAQYQFAATVRGRLIRISVQEAYDMTIGRLNIYADGYGNSFCDRIEDIINGGDAFYDIDRNIPEEKKRIFQVK